MDALSISATVLATHNPILFEPDGLETTLADSSLASALVDDNYLPKVVETLQTLSDELHYFHPLDVDNLRGAVFYLTALTSGGHDRQTIKTSLQKIAGQLKTIPRDRFLKAVADIVGNEYRNLTLFGRRSDEARLARKLLEKRSQAA